MSYNTMHAWHLFIMNASKGSYYVRAEDIIKTDRQLWDEMSRSSIELEQ
jgi:hypothetical protein